MTTAFKTTRRLAAYAWQFKLTGAGKCLIGGGLFATALAMSSVQQAVYNILIVLLVLGALAVLVNLCYRPRLRLEARFPEKVVVGQEVRVRVTIRNVGRLPAFDVSAGFLHLPRMLEETTTDERIPCLPAGESASFTVGIRPVRRGVYTLPPLRAYTTFPFNLARSGSTKTSANNLTVIPAFTSADGIDLPVTARHQPGGIAFTSNVGESTEYIGNREYRPGDSMRRLDVRAWARLAKPVVCEYQEEYFCRVGLVLDTYVPGLRRAPAEGFPALEAAISFAATITDALSRGEYVLDIFAAGPELYVFRSGRHTAHFDNVLEILACIDACRRNPFEKVTPALVEELHNISSVIFVLLDWDDDRRRLVRSAEEAGCRTKVLIVRDDPTTQPLAMGPGTEDIQTYTIESIRSGGFTVL